MKFLNFVLTKVSFILNRAFKPEETKEVRIEPEFGISNEIKKEEKQLVVLLGVRQLKGDLPYYFEVESAALFQFDELPEEKILKQFSVINCPAIMFPYIRETIADLTRRAGFQPLHLNPVNFIQLAKEREERLKQVASAPSI
ncbi:MAG: protein-export chaperone SecB [Nitrospiraceae bacterium]|nr:protein-export chaperone SecB [Nitrospiraceae bacterium]